MRAIDLRGHTMSVFMLACRPVSAFDLLTCNGIIPLIAAGFAIRSFVSCSAYLSRPAATDICAGCAYDLRGLARNAVCPECGATDRATDVPTRAWIIGGWFDLLIAFAAAGIVLAALPWYLYAACRFEGFAHQPSIAYAFENSVWDWAGGYAAFFLAAVLARLYRHSERWTRHAATASAVILAPALYLGLVLQTGGSPRATQSVEEASTLGMFALLVGWLLICAMTHGRDSPQVLSSQTTPPSP